MSTRSVVARPYGDGFAGRYVHSDGYPSGVGAWLWNQHRDAFDGDTEAMAVRLVDDEPVGWSALCGHDLSKPAAWDDFGERYRDSGLAFGRIDHERYYAECGPQSYSARGETGDMMVAYCGPGTGFDSDCEWAYVLGVGGMVVWRLSGPNPEPEVVALVAWDGPEPDWDEMELVEAAAA